MPKALLLDSSAPRSPAANALRATLGAALPGWSIAGTTTDEDERSWRGPVGISRTIAGADLIVLTDGWPFERATGSPSARARLLARALPLIAAGGASDKPLAMIGIAVEPLRGAAERRLAQAMVRASDLCIVGDRDSARALTDAGVPAPLRVGADPVWSAVGPARSPLHAVGAAANGDRRRARIEIAVDEVSSPAALVDRLAAAILPLLATDRFEVLVQPWHVDPTEPDDVEVAHALRAALGPGVRIAGPPADLASARDRYADAELVVAISDRPIIAAAAAGTRLVALSERAATRRLARRLLQPAVAVDDAGAMTAAILMALDGQPPLGSAVAAEIDAAEESFRLLRLLAAEGHTDDAEEVSGLPLEPAPGS